MSLRESMKKSREKLKKKSQEDVIADDWRERAKKRFMKPDQETYDEFFAEADSLWKQQHVLKEGEPWPKNENIMMFDVNTGDLSDEYRAQFNPETFVSLAAGDTHRGFHYKNLIGDAAKKNIGTNELSFIQMNDMFKAVESYFKDGPLYNKKGRAFSPYEIYNIIDKDVQSVVPGDRNSDSSTFRDMEVSKTEKWYVKEVLPGLMKDLTNKKPDTDKKK